MIILTFGDRIRTIRENMKLNQADFALQIGLKTPMAISAYENNQTEPDISKLITISKLGNISLDALLTGSGPAKIPPVLHEDETANDDDFVTIPRFDDKISAGSGLIPANNIEIKIAFRKDWIHKKGDPNRMSIIRVSGDSMEPTLMPDDLVLINHGHNHVDPQGGIYAITIDDHIMIKRIQVVYPSDKLKIISDNRKYDSTEVAFDQVKINGKLIWFGREI